MDSPVLIVRSHIHDDVKATLGNFMESYSLSIDFGENEIFLFKHITFASSIIGFMYEAINILNKNSISPYISDPDDVIRNFNDTHRSNSAKDLVEILDQSIIDNKEENIDNINIIPSLLSDLRPTQLDRI